MLDESTYPKININTYQKETELKNGTKLLLRPMVAEDQDALYEFFKEIPREDARYLRDDVSSRLLVEKWAKNLDYEKTLPILAIKDDAIIGNATINRRRFGWKWHLGTVRIFVHKEYRDVGLGRLMIDELVDIAYKLGIEKLIVEIPDLSTAASRCWRTRTPAAGTCGRSSATRSGATPKEMWSGRRRRVWVA